VELVLFSLQEGRMVAMFVILMSRPSCLYLINHHIMRGVSLGLIRHHEVRTCGETKAQPHAFSTSARDGSVWTPHGSVALLPIPTPMDEKLGGS
jgi:hypothetical protein